jgi:hypothetical protein
MPRSERLHRGGLIQMDHRVELLWEPGAKIVARELRVGPIDDPDRPLIPWLVQEPQDSGLIAKRQQDVPCANGLSVVEGSRWGELRLDGAEMLQQGVELGNVLGQRPLLALHLRDQHFELEYFNREAPGQVVLLAHRPRLGG